MTSPNRFLAEVRDIIRRKLELGWSLHRIAREAGLSGRNTLKGWDKPDWNPRMNTVRKIHPKGAQR
jgi:DNA-binding phage protein